MAKEVATAEVAQAKAQSQGQVIAAQQETVRLRDLAQMKLDVAHQQIAKEQRDRNQAMAEAQEALQKKVQEVG